MLTAVAIVAGACTNDGASEQGATPTGVGSAGASSASPSPAAPLTADDYSPSLFGEASATIDNQWLPMSPGAQLLYEGMSGLGRERLPHRLQFTVTDLTKVIDGVRTAVVWEQDFSDGELVEAELSFFAQDLNGNVWHFGEYPEEYEDGKFDKAPTWFAEVAGASAGITMMADPMLGTPDYAQGFAPKPINWADRGRVHEVGVSVCVPADCYDDVLVTEEFELDKPRAYQLKFYAAGLGNVRVGWGGKNEDDHEILELIEASTLSAEALSEVRDMALAHEAHAYEISPDVYGTTPPLEPAAT